MRIEYFEIFIKKICLVIQFNPKFSKFNWNEWLNTAQLLIETIINSYNVILFSFGAIESKNEREYWISLSIYYIICIMVCALFSMLKNCSEYYFNYCYYYE